MYIERACRDQIDEVVKEGTYIFKYSLRTQEIFVIYKGVFRNLAGGDKTGIFGEILNFLPSPPQITEIYIFGKGLTFYSYFSLFSHFFFHLFVFYPLLKFWRGGSSKMGGGWPADPFCTTPPPEYAPAQLYHVFHNCLPEISQEK